MKIKLTIEVDYSKDDIDDDHKHFLENEIFIGNGNLILHSNTLGDEVGKITLVENIQFLNNFPTLKSNL